MDLFDAIAKRASVRELKPVDVPERDLERILDAGRRAPSGRNRQPIEFIVVRKQETLEKLAQAQKCIADVNLAICIAADPAKSIYWLEDVSAAATNMLLAIAALGYGSVWIEGTLMREEAKHRQALGIPEGMRLMVCLPIGAPARPPQQAGKRPLSDLVHWESYGARGWPGV
jgi:nitroreductase